MLVVFLFKKLNNVGKYEGRSTSFTSAFVLRNDFAHNMELERIQLYCDTK